MLDNYIKFYKKIHNRIPLYECQSIIKEIDRVYEIKYELRLCKWILHKIKIKVLHLGGNLYAVPFINIILIIKDFTFKLWTNFQILFNV